MLALLEKAYTLLKPHLFKHTPIIFSIKGSIVAMLCVFIFSKYVQLFCSILFVGKYDNVNASHRYGIVKEKNWRTNLVQRSYNAHMNHFEAFVEFSIAVICFLLWGSSSSNAEAMILTNAFIFVRIAYNIAYVVAGTPPLAAIRSALYMTGLIIIMRIFSLAIPEGFFA